MKLSKRDFVKGAAASVVAVAATGRGAAASSGAVRPGRAPTAGEPALPGKEFDVVVYNDWFPQACAFADQHSEQGVRTLPVAGDAGRLWYGTLRALTKNGHRRIAGMTTHTDLLILETLGREQGLRVSQRNGAGRLVSWVLT
jgi:hypothetical protein